MSGAPSHHGVNRDNFNFERCDIVNDVGDWRGEGKRTGHKNFVVV